MTPKIRSATAGDRDSILSVVRDAFSDAGRDASEEVGIVLETWARDAAVDRLELVAVEDGDVVGHVLGARGELAGRDVVGIAPLAVSPARQRQGIGSALMTELLDRADTDGWPLVVLLGSPVYYARFGFEPAGSFGITYAPVGAGNPHFQVRRLGRDDAAYSGTFRYCWETEPAR